MRRSVVFLCGPRVFHAIGRFDDERVRPRYSTRVRKGLEASRRVDNSQVVQKRIDLDL